MAVATVSVSSLPASSLANRRNGLPGLQAAADDLVSGDLPDQPGQDQTVGLSAQAPVGGELPNCLADAPQADAGIGHARRTICA